ncbi:MAG: tol-pal system YbgF family protein [Bacteroidales bacterium]
MSKATKEAPKAETIENIESALSKTEIFILENKKSLSIILGGIILAIGLYIGFNKLYLEPLGTEAQAQMFVAEQHFEKDSFNLALNGDGSNLGFLEIAEEYSITPAGNLAKYYAGVCQLRLGQYQEAIDMLSSFDGTDNIVSNVALGAIGDAYAELENSKEAINYYLKAANNVVNDFSTPLYLFRAAILQEQLNQPDKALTLFKRIRDEFPTSVEGRNMEKYIARLEALQAK